MLCSYYSCAQADEQLCGGISIVLRPSEVDAFRSEVDDATTYRGLAAGGASGRHAFCHQLVRQVAHTYTYPATFS